MADLRRNLIGGTIGTLAAKSKDDCLPEMVSMFNGMGWCLRGFDLDCGLCTYGNFTKGLGFFQRRNPTFF
jgi:hypothetical protein